MPAFSKILFPVDFSDRCTGAAHYVTAIAGRFGSRVTMLHVMESMARAADIDFGGLAVQTIAAETAEHYRNLLDGFQLDDDRISVDRMLETGDPARVIIDIAHSGAFDLIVMPTHGYGGFRRFILGSVTAKVLHDANCPVWTGVHLEDSPDLSSISFKNIGCSLEMDENKLTPLDVAADFAAEYGADLIVVHVVPTADAAPARYMDTDLRSTLIKDARAFLEEHCERRGVKARICVGSGDVASSVAASASNHRADLLVIGRPHHHGLGRLKEHSYSIIRESPCPVLSV